MILARPGGLTLSDAAAPQEQQQAARALTFDTKRWSLDRDADYTQRQFDLVRAAAEAPFTGRTASRLELARFYFARQMYAEAKAVLDTAIADERPTAEEPAPLVLRAVANIMLGRVEAAQKDLANPVVGNQNDAPLWRALALARQGKWPEARDAFRNVEGALGALPLELQRIALKDALRAAIEVGDFANAVNRLNDFKTIGLSPEVEPAVVGADRAPGRRRVGRPQDALAAYRFAAASERPAGGGAGPAARDRAALFARRDQEARTSSRELENLTTAWRGDETEVEALQTAGAALHRDGPLPRRVPRHARGADARYPSSPLTRNIQQEAAKTFDTLFLAGKGDALPAIDALGLFYDFRELTPIGRRGDEMIRKLAERLVSVDLLDQGAELLAIPGRQPPAGRRARAGGDAARGDLSDEPQAGQGAGGAARDPHRRPLQRDPRAAADDRGARAVRHRPPRFRARGDRRPRGPRGAPAALRHLLGVAQLAEGGRADRAAVRRPLEELRAARPTPSAPTCCAPASPMRWPRTGSAPRGCATNTRPRWREGPDGRAFDVVTGGLGATQPGVPRGGADRGVGRHAVGLPARPARALSGDAGAFVPSSPETPAPQSRALPPDPSPTGTTRRRSAKNRSGRTVSPR